MTDDEETTDKKKDEVELDPLTLEGKVFLNSALLKCGRTKNEVYTALAWPQSEGSQFVSLKNPKQFPWTKIGDFCKETGCIAPLEWQAKRAGYACLSIEELAALKSELAAYQKLFADAVPLVKKTFDRFVEHSFSMTFSKNDKT